MTDEGQPRWRVVEHQVWKACAFTGMTTYGLATGTLFLHFLLLALEAATKISSVGLPGTATIVLVSLLFSKLVVGRLWQFSVVAFLSIASFLGRLIQPNSEMDREAIEEQRSKTELTGVLSFGVLGMQGVAFFHISRWSCATARPTGSLMHSACIGSNGGLFQTIQIEVVRLSGAAWGVGGVFLLVVALLEVQAAWRNSWLQRRYRSSRLHFWIHPMKNFESSWTGDSEDDNPSHSKDDE